MGNRTTAHAMGDGDEACTALFDRAFERRRRVRRSAHRKAIRMIKYGVVFYAFIALYEELFAAPPQLLYRLAVTAAVLCLLVAVTFLLLSFIFGKLVIASAKMKYNRRTSW